MTRYAEHVAQATQAEPQRADQVKNSAGGYVFAIDTWKRLDRWLVLGAAGGTYYATERALTRDNAQVIEACLKEDPKRTVARIVEMSESGRIPKNDTAIFALALAASASPEARKEACAAIPRVCRTGTHLFQFVGAVGQFRGWGRELRRAVARWYEQMPAEKLAYQVAKYQQREGWAHRDVLRLAHARPVSAEHNAIFRWCVAGQDGFTGEAKRGEAPSAFALPKILIAMQQTRGASARDVVRLIREHGLTHEMIPNEVKGEREVWDALLEKMPLQAMIRSLSKMTAIGLVAPLSDGTKRVVEALGSADAIRRSRLHPIALLSALKTYAQGRGEKGSLTWEPVPAVVDALDAAFYAAFGNVEPSGKNTLIGLDVSGSMSAGAVAGVAGLTPRVASAAMAMVMVKTEPNVHCIAFTSSFTSTWGGIYGQRENGVTPLDFSKCKRLDDVLKKTDGLPFGATDCSLPMRYAEQQRIGVDVFQIYTDNETWHGPVHPHIALRSYRKATGRPAKSAVIGMTATGFTIADPDDAGMLDVVGFDTATPALLADFAAGRV